MRLSRALEDKKMDLRLRDKLVHEGKLGVKEVEEYFRSLPDDSDKLTVTSRQEQEKEADSPTES